MKTSFFASLLLLALSTIVSCDPSAGTDTTGTQTVSSGSWRVALFTDSGNDETTNFTGYSFTFSENGVISAVKAGVTKNGNWSINSSSTKFNIGLGINDDSNKPLGELTDDWKILSYTNSEIKLTDDNASSNEFLTFTKN